MLDEPTVGLDPVLRRDCGASSTGSPPTAPPSWCPATSWTRRAAATGCCSCARAHPRRRHPARSARRHRCGRRRAGLPHPRRPRRRQAEVVGMNPRLTLVTAGRVLRQIRHDPRTIGLLVVVPCVLLGLLAWIYKNTPVFDLHRRPAARVFPFVVDVPRDQHRDPARARSGTLERLLTLPLGKGDLLGGYAVAFGAARGGAGRDRDRVRGLGARPRRRRAAVAAPVVAVVDAVLGTALGLFLSAFAATEFQAVQFLPAFILPQFLLCGLLIAARPAARRPARDQQRAAALLRGRRHADHHHRPLRRRRRGQGRADRARFRGRALAAGAATLRRRTA